MEGSANDHTFVFADLAGFTAMTEAMGDRPAADVARGFCRQVEDAAPRFEAEVVKRIGDAVMVRSDLADRAVRFALHAAHSVGDSHYLPTVRVGMHTGPAIERDGDWYGAAVNLAARVSGEAAGSEVLLTEATRLAAGDLDGVELRERGRRAMRNVGEPVLLYAAVPEGAGAAEGLPIDPVCRMAVDPAHCAGNLVHEGREYRFCSLACVERFAAGPDRYAGTS